MNEKTIIHNYYEYDTPANVSVFSDESKTDVISLVAIGQGTMKIISDQGSVMSWSILYTPSSNGTVLSPDHYHQSNISRYFSFYPSGDRNCNGKIASLDNNEREVESIQMRRTDNGEWMTTNQVLMATQSNHHIVNAVNRRSERIKKRQLAANTATQREEDDSELFQQQSNSWTTQINSQVIDQMVGNSHDAATTMPTELIATSPATGLPESTPAPTPSLTTNLPSNLSPQMKDLKLWHQRMGHSSTQSIIETSKCTKEIPELPTNTPFFKCPYCEKAKIVKKSGNKSKDEDVYIPW